MFDEASALFGTIKMCKTTQGELAARLGVSQSYIANKLRLLKLSPTMREAIIENGLSERHARALLRIGEEKERRLALSRICAERLTVADSEAMIDDMLLFEAPRRIRDGDKDAKITRIKGLIESAVYALSSSGVSAESAISQIDGRLVITLAIDGIA